MAVSSSPDRRPPRYRKRRPLPALVLIVILGVIAGLVWVNVLNRPDLSADGCGPPASPSAAPVQPPAPAPGELPAPQPVPVEPAPPVPGRALPDDALDAVAPAPPQLVRVQVFNGGDERGAAGIAAGSIYELGFIEAGPPNNDPLYPAGDLTCHGQIRFGTAGEAAARTLSLVLPCAELVRDVRPDDIVDFSVGTEFASVRPTDATRSVLAALDQLGAPPAAEPATGGQAAEPAQPTLDEESLRAARAVEC